MRDELSVRGDRMSFGFRLSCPSAGTVSSLAEGELEDRSDYEYLSMMGCRVLSGQGCTFHISGFGSDDWRFDVEYDMSTLVEQIPKFVEGLAVSGNAEIDFYSQGVERSVSAERADGELLLRCHSRTSWKPQPATERISVLKMEVMIAEFMSEFSLSLKRAGSEIADLEPFSRWRIDPQEILT